MGPDIGVEAKLASLRQTSESEVNWNLTFQAVNANSLPRHSLAKSGISIIWTVEMERRDGKDPFDAATYTSPATIKSMIELRAFCAAFFEEHVRDHSPTSSQKLLDQFLNLICHSNLLFARARAVIPELQLQSPKSKMMHTNPSIQRVLQLTEELRGSPDSISDHLIEESAWTRLAKDGQEQYTKEAERIAKNLKENRAGNSGSPMPSALPATPASMAPTESPEHKEQAAGPVSPLLLSIPSSIEPLEARSVTKITTAPGAMEKPDSSSVHDLSMLSVKVPIAEAGRNLRSIRLENIPTFIPRNQMNNACDLVWSPTSGTRQRKLEGKVESQRRDQAVPAIFGQEISGNIPNSFKPHPILASIMADTSEYRHGHGLSTAALARAETYHSPTSPLAPAGSLSTRPKTTTLSSCHIRNDSEVDPLPNSGPSSAGLTPGIGGQLDQAGLADDHEDVSLYPEFSNLQHLVNRTHGIVGTGSLSAPPRTSGIGDLRDTGQGTHGGPEDISHEFQARYGQYGPVGSPLFQSQPGQVPYIEARSSSFRPQLGQASFSDLEHPPSKLWHAREQHSKPRRHRQSYREGQHSVVAYPQQQSIDFSQSIWNPQAANPIDQVQQMSYGVPANESLTVPAPGSMHPVDYWDMLYQREIDIHKDLASAGIPMTDVQHDYVARLGEARIAAVASKMPLRGQMAPIEWLDVLAKELDRLHLPGVMPLTSVIVDRKKDYGKAVRREIELVEIELGIE